MRLLLVSGLPASGKTTLARELARRYAAPLLAKDLIKEPLLDVLTAKDREQSRLLSTASFAVLFACAGELMSAGIDLLLEGNFRPGEHENALRALPPAQVFQVLCRVGEPERMRRLAACQNDRRRHPGHRDRDWVASDTSADSFLDISGERAIFDGRNIGAIDAWWHSRGS